MAMMKGERCNCPHHKVFALIVILVGVAFLMRDIGSWNFWNLNWWTVGFLMLGIKKLHMCHCCGNGSCYC